MKILMINVVCGVRSTGRICTDLAEALEKRGHEVKIAYGRENVPARYERFAVKVCGKADVRLHALRARISDDAGFGSRNATKKLINFIRGYDPDVIHLHNIHGYYLNVPELFSYLKTCGKRIVWTLHDCWAFTGHAAYCEAANCFLWRTGCHNCPKKNDYPKSLIDRSERNWRVKRELFCGVPEMRLAVPSVWLKGLCGESFLKNYPVTVVYNGVDDSVFRPSEEDIKARLGAEGKKLALGVAAVWDGRKGLDDMIKLASLLDPEKWAVALVGLTEKQEASLPEGVVSLGRAEGPEELAKIYSAADVFVNPTYEDNFPTTNIEALACGTPVVTYDTGGSPEAAGNIAGAVVKKGDVRALKAAVEGLDVPTEICLERSRLFTKESMLEGYLRLIEGGASKQ